MTYSPKRLAQFVAPSLETTYYTVPANTFTIVKNVVFANSYPSPVSVSLSVVPSGQVAGFENRIVPGISIPANSTVSLDLSTVMAEGDYLSASATIGSAVAVTISGVEEMGNGLALGGTAGPSATGIQTVTSITRPATPSLGQSIYESDTGKILTWSGVAWTREQPTATLAYAENLNLAQAITTTTDITGLTVAVTVPAGRRIRIKGMCYCNSNTADARSAMYVFEDGVQVQGGFVQHSSTGINTTLEVDVVRTPTAGTHTYKLVGGVNAGTTTLGGAATHPAFILVEDITGDPSPYVSTSVPVGVLAQVQNFASGQSNISSGTLTDITGSELNIVVPAGRTIRLSAKVHGSATSGAETRFRLAIMEGGTILNAAYRVFSGANFGEDVSVQAIISPSAGAHTYKLAGSRDNSSVSVVIYSNSSDGQTYFIAEDITPTPAVASSAPSSTLAYAPKSAHQTGISAETTITELTATVVVAAGRRLRVSAALHALSSVAGQGAQAKIKMDGAEVQFAEMAPAASRFELYPNTILTPTAGSHTFTVTVVKTGASNTVDIQSWSTDPSYLLVEDITTNSMPVPASTGFWLPGNSAPASPSIGDIFYNNSTGKLLVWDGVAWVLPRNVAGGYLTATGNMNGSYALALSKGTAEQAFSTTPAIQTFANRRYRINAMLTLTNGGSWNGATLRIRRGTTTAGTQLRWTFVPRNTTTAWNTVELFAYDVPGAQATQQWCVTHAIDTSVCDVYAPEWISVEDVGAT